MMVSLVADAMLETAFIVPTACVEFPACAEVELWYIVEMMDDAKVVVDTVEDETIKSLVLVPESVALDHPIEHESVDGGVDIASGEIAS